MAKRLPRLKIFALSDTQYLLVKFIIISKKMIIESKSKIAIPIDIINPCSSFCIFFWTSLIADIAKEYWSPFKPESLKKTKDTHFLHGKSLDIL